jgi:hypothetical protein
LLAEKQDQFNRKPCFVKKERRFLRAGKKGSILGHFPVNILDAIVEREKYSLPIDGGGVG